MKDWSGKRDVVIVTGADAESYLQGQITQDLEAIADGASEWSFVLQPQGKVDAWFRITRDGDRFVLDVDEGWGDPLVSRLRRFLLRVDVELASETWEGDSPDPDADEHRIEAGLPAMGAELTEETIPNATGVVERSVSFTKGCYTGQELVARVDSRGNNTPEQLRRLRGSGETPEVGMTFSVDGEVAGRFTSVAGSDGNWVGLGYVKRSAADAEEAMTGGGAARIERVGDFA